MAGPTEYRLSTMAANTSVLFTKCSIGMIEASSTTCLISMHRLKTPSGTARVCSAWAWKCAIASGIRSGVCRLSQAGRRPANGGQMEEQRRVREDGTWSCTSHS